MGAGRWEDNQQLALVVILSEAKDLCERHKRSFASLRMTLNNRFSLLVLRADYTIRSY